MYSLTVVVQPAGVSVFQSGKDPWSAKEDDTGTGAVKKPGCLSLLQLVSPGGNVSAHF